MNLRLIALLLAVVFSTACRGQQKIPDGVEVLHDVEYGKVNGRALHLEIARPKDVPAKPMPVVLWVHGGGWQGGTHKEMHAIGFAAKGWFTASVEYRLSGEAKWPAQIEDCKLAVRWLRANAKKWNIDPDRIGVWGLSAGGHLVSCLGTMGESAGYDVGEHTNFSSRVQAVVNYSGPTDFTKGEGGLMSQQPEEATRVLQKLLGGSFKDKPENWRAASPITWVTSNASPFLVVQGEADALVPMHHPEVLVAELKKAGVPVEFIRMKNGNHVLYPDQRGKPTEPSMKEVNQRVVKFFEQNLLK
jgi:acetyl esterase/lipase